MVKGIPAFLAMVSDPAHLCAGVAAGLGPLVVPAPYGYIIGSIVGITLVLGLALLERMDSRDLDDQDDKGRRGSARFRRPMFGRRVRFVVGRSLARATS
jgi:hypothetical protein